MATLKEHQAAMVDLLANGSGIPASASRLAHAMHDVLEIVANSDLMKTIQKLSADNYAVLRACDDATTPGLNDKALSKPQKALKTDSHAKWPTPTEQRVRELENTIRQLKANLVEVRSQRDNWKEHCEHMSKRIIEQEQAGCRRPDTQMCEHLWNKTDLYNVFGCLRCGVQEIKK